ncbi:MAG: hypothetical protein Q4F18_10970 [Clostridia bacterium]|nr:hypothetical protein [Clostridia bacterium]
MTAQDITAPAGSIELCGETHALLFDHEQIRQTELCWQRTTGNVMGYLGILRQAEIGVYTAIFAVCYGALLSCEKHGGTPDGGRTTLERFDALADYQALISMGPDIVATAMTALPAAGTSAKKA